MRRHWLQCLALFVLTAGACLLSLVPGLSEPPADKADLRKEGDAVNRFAADLYRQVGRESGNLFCSPYSIRTALAMTEAGAAGQTGEEMRQTLRLGADPKRHMAAGLLSQKLLPGDKAAYQLNVANAIWVQDGFALAQPFTDMLAKEFRSQSRQVDFAGQAEAARGAINQWVERQTKDKIKELLKAGTIKPETKLVLTNAIYFKGRWETPFKKTKTKEEPFFADGQETKAPLMTQTEEFRYFENDLLQLVRLPYEKCPLEMVVLLPRSKTGLGELEKAFTAEALATWSREARTAEVTLFLPRFKQTAEFDLGGTLGQMGMPTAFTNDADFTGMTSAQRLKIDKVVHKAFVEVNEEGAEAAAATGVTMMPTAAPAPKKHVTVRADHPFLYLIQDRETGAILFVGRCAKPQE